MNDTREDLLCRTCLIKKNEMKWIYDSNVSDLLMDCTSIKVEKNDGLPGYVCVDCEELIRKFYAFRQQCQKSEKILQELKNQKKDFLHTEKTFFIKHPKDDNNLQLTNFSVAKYECVIFKDDSSLKINDYNDTDSFGDDYNQIKVKDESIDYLDSNVENSSDQFKCTVCNKTLSSNATLKRHSKMHETKNIEIKKSEKDDLKQNKDNKFMCMTCDRIFKSYTTLQKHEKTHDSNYVPQECKICKKTYADKKSLQKHMGRHTGNMPYKCTECPKKCYERSDLAKHLKSHLNLEPIKCKDCDMTFMLKEQLKMHVSKAHKAGHICKHCGKAMSSSSNLRKHELVHSNHRPYKCTFCEKSFKNFTARRIHMKQHIDTDRKILCNICGGSFVDIRMHMMKHTLNKPHKCPECGKGFRTNFDLQEHMPKHTGKPRPMPCLCTVCGKRFPYASRLRVHMRKHTGDLPCVCKICGRAFAQTSQLNLHTRKHTGQLPFCCGVCTRSFAASNQLDEHMRVHTGEKPFRCPTCGKSFRVNGTLVVHLRVHTGERPYKCIICEKAFTQPNALKNHLKVHNKSQTEEDVNSNLSEIKPEQQKI